MAARITIDLNLQPVPTIVGVLVWSFRVSLEAIISTYNRKWRRLTDGSPTIMVGNGTILESNLKRMNLNMDDLRMQVRSQGVFDMADLGFAILEPSGNLSVLLKSQRKPVTPADPNIPTDYAGVPVELVMDGKIIHKNLEQLDLSREWLDSKLQEWGLKPADVFYAEMDTKGNLFVDVFNDPKGQRHTGNMGEWEGDAWPAIRSRRG